MDTSGKCEEILKILLRLARKHSIVQIEVNSFTNPDEYTWEEIVEKFLNYLYKIGE